MRRIGVAVGNRVTATAQPLAALRARDGIPDWAALGALIDEWHPALLLVGNPLNMDGSPSDMSRRAATFARRLQGRFNLPADMVDERLSSFEAQQLLQDPSTGRPANPAQSTDALAAELILRTWLDMRP